MNCSVSHCTQVLHGWLCKPSIGLVRQRHNIVCVRIMRTGCRPLASFPNSHAAASLVAVASCTPICQRHITNSPTPVAVHVDQVDQEGKTEYPLPSHPQQTHMHAHPQPHHVHSPGPGRPVAGSPPGLPALQQLPVHHASRVWGPPQPPGPGQPQGQPQPR